MDDIGDGCDVGSTLAGVVVSTLLAKDRSDGQDGRNRNRLSLELLLFLFGKSSDGYRVPVDVFQQRTTSSDWNALFVLRPRQTGI